MSESQVDDLLAVQEDVNLKLALWNGSAEFDAVIAGWKDTHFNSLDLVQMEELVTRYEPSFFPLDYREPPLGFCRHL